MTPYTTPCERGDVVLVPFPFTNLITDKKRPAVILSANWYNSVGKDLILAKITGSISNSINRDEVLLSSDELSSAGLVKTSIIQVGRVFSLEKTLVIKKLGHLTDDTLNKIDLIIKDIFGIG
ncbi:MAG: type II toxin-antitoxin system PemK/MazF family toxin [Chloroflexota bacterium]|jgi:mRNA interferase MazF